mmetsp:Transcript_22328/g.63940  ORF Transcript_22328/g.63940 Transcript_22328/m.63940 type:complete len:288 (+) Transcript_22328:1620-2483(+)
MIFPSELASSFSALMQRNCSTSSMMPHSCAWKPWRPKTSVCILRIMAVRCFAYSVDPGRHCAARAASSSWKPPAENSWSKSRWMLSAHSTLSSRSREGLFMWPAASNNTARRLPIGVEGSSCATPSSCKAQIRPWAATSGRPSLDAAACSRSCTDASAWTDTSTNSDAPLIKPTRTFTAERSWLACGFCMAAAGLPSRVVKRSRRRLPKSSLSSYTVATPPGIGLTIRTEERKESSPVCAAAAASTSYMIASARTLTKISTPPALFRKRTSTSASGLTVGFFASFSQ